MYPTKSYGKVDESEQAILESRRKTRRRITIIALSTIVLVAVVCAAVLGSVAHNNGNNEDDNNNIALSNSVKAVCDVTLYKETCYSSLSALVHSSGKGQVLDPEELFFFSVKVALAEVSRASQHFNGQFGNFKRLLNNGTNQRAQEALNNCQDLLGLTIDHLNSSLGYSWQKFSLDDNLDDLKTWLSAAGTYQEACIDGLVDEGNESLKTSIVSYLKNSTQLTSNSLAIVTWINKAVTTINLNKRRRRLLSLWNSNGRKLLLQNNNDYLKVKADIVVAKDGTAKYKTISAALKHVPEESQKRTVIYVKKGIYYENVRVEKNKWNVMIIGDGMNATIVSGSLNFVDGTPTFSTATFAVFGRNFIAREIGFRNTAGPQKHQAVALLTTADQAIYYRCLIDGFQDTLYVQANRQFYRECNIYGTVDLIFGNSAVVIQNSNIVPKVPMQGQQNTITAQGKSDPNMNTGISIQNCSIAPSSADLNSVQTYLGRPWKNYSTTVFMQSTIQSFIDPKGWLPWVGNSAPDTIFYAEFQNIGPGSSTKNRVNWKGVKSAINNKQANLFTVKEFISGDRWIPATSAPFKSSL
ncbi:hypothetical protein PIB30_036517 [Stylosanthes scabra]|uniref:Pectinesterase inhibitor domain-containing protein n=1 Tax=Stylosanthes scabra TaxID=79078 RepID=A0ABU6RE41_9FABA|nr:hypothetical protein [Stylosanthes scabra]